MKTMVEAALVHSLNGARRKLRSRRRLPPEVAPSRPVRPRHTQSAEQAVLAAAVRVMLAGLQAADEPLRTLLEPDGLTTPCIAAYTAQHATALAAHEARQQAMAAEKQTVATLNAAFAHAY
ncbi:MAG: hypothetical protein R6W76_09640 [Caldilinea sp.]